MREISKSRIGKELATLIEEEHPVDEDICILDEKGEISAAVITKDAYQFFLRKVEEAEDEIDNATVNEFHNSGEKDHD
jgi:PHD/YefM family antitoxin component YafN of YafNO toxin-antitoxin module